MDDTKKVVSDIKKALLDLKYDDPKLDSIRQNLTIDILKYMHSKVKTIEEKTVQKDINLVEPIPHYRNMPMKPIRYKFMKERNK